MPAPSTARSLETGVLLAALTVTLAATGLLLSPTFMTWVGGETAVAETSNGIYVAHLVAAVMLGAFVVWHLLPLRHAFARRPGLSPFHRWNSYVTLAIVLLLVLTGVELWSHVYVPFSKRDAVLLHLGATFALAAPIAAHAWKGARIWWRRREAADAAWTAAEAAGRADEAVAARVSAARRAFLRLAAYGAAALLLASAIGTAAQRQLEAWRVNSIGATPALTKESYRLKVTGLVNAPIELTYDELVAMPTRTLTFTHHCVEGWTYTDEFTGVPLRAVLERAGGVRGGARQLVFKSPERSRHIFTWNQQYTTNFPVEDGMHDDVLLVFKAHGEDLPPIHGFPVRLMTPRKWGYKACKWLTEIEATADADYRGYWERAGYHNDGDYPGPIWG